MVLSLLESDAGVASEVLREAGLTSDRVTGYLKNP